MNTQIKKLVGHLEEIYNGDPWYGENIFKKLHSITAEQANWHPHPEANSIAQILQHMINWKQLVINKLKNNDPHNIELNSKEDWDKTLTITSEKEWRELVNTFKAAQDELIVILSTQQDGDLQQQVSGRSYNIDYLINGIYEHNLYHLGQIGYIHSLSQKR